jgi:hypothetical protein
MKVDNEVRLNLPGNPNHDPDFPRVMKWNNQMNNIAGDIIAFVDALRLSGMTEEHAWQIACHVWSLCFNG